MSTDEVTAVIQKHDPQHRGNTRAALDLIKEAYPPAKDLDDSRRSATQVIFYVVFFDV